jgi:hypothetical protein
MIFTAQKSELAKAQVFPMSMRKNVFFMARITERRVQTRGKDTFCDERSRKFYFFEAAPIPKGVKWHYIAIDCGMYLSGDGMKCFRTSAVLTALRMYN